MKGNTAYIAVIKGDDGMIENILVYESVFRACHDSRKRAGIDRAFSRDWRGGGKHGDLFLSHGAPSSVQVSRRELK